MTKEQKVAKVIEDYLYTRDDILDLNDIPEIVRELTIRLVVI